MKRKRCHGVAPSMVAASYSEGDTVCSPASSVIATNGTPRQILAKITDQRAFQMSPRKLMLVVIRCILFSDQETIAESTVGTMNGIRTTARMIALNGSFSFNNSAR